jgi:hypothetical protein
MGMLGRLMGMKHFLMALFWAAVLCMACRRDSQFMIAWSAIGIFFNVNKIIGQEQQLR